MMRVLATVVLSMLVVGPTLFVGTASATEPAAIVGDLPLDAARHCPMDINNYLFRLGDWLAACLD